jgi:hypothetical protein
LWLWVRWEGVDISRIWPRDPKFPMNSKVCNISSCALFPSLIVSQPATCSSYTNSNLSHPGISSWEAPPSFPLFSFTSSKITYILSLISWFLSSMSWQYDEAFSYRSNLPLVVIALIFSHVLSSVWSSTPSTRIFHFTLHSFTPYASNGPKWCPWHTIPFIMVTEKDSPNTLFNKQHCNVCRHGTFISTTNSDIEDLIVHWTHWSTTHIESIYDCITIC